MDQQAAAKHSEDRHKIEEGFVINGGCVVELCKVRAETKGQRRT
jgi:hypothetical protein